MDKAKLEELLLEGINLQHKINLIQDISDLADSRRLYILWRKKLQDYFAQNPELFINTSKVFEVDEVMSTIDRGAGIDLDDPFAKKLKSYLKTEIKDKLAFIRDFSKETFIPAKNRLFTKDGAGRYFYKGKFLLVLPPKTLYADFFKIVFNFCDPEGFISDELIEKHLTSMGYEIKQATLKNAKDSFFKNIKINGTSLEGNMTPDQEEIISRPRKKKGFVFYNPEMV